MWQLFNDDDDRDNNIQSNREKQCDFKQCKDDHLLHLIFRELQLQIWQN
jgi:hypothetical protein